MLPGLVHRSSLPGAASVRSPTIGQRGTRSNASSMSIIRGLRPTITLLVYALFVEAYVSSLFLPAYVWPEATCVDSAVGGL